ncbi:hypothetical protein OYT88_16680 [Sporolactobacillus sp. CQH2019]|uniref:hypothetical protein n=1 Tax=Sporolactobacillus sp. CQH2019 TaxID=3023512 RepID=UPI002368BBE4|nr:hypothetical protein [Sporolactobacillus sp. CQH2019]MDD9150178.1 hypothetical protein [Sporolactobacillus sp. CQH2019]
MAIFSDIFDAPGEPKIFLLLLNLLMKIIILCIFQIKFQQPGQSVIPFEVEDLSDVWSVPIYPTLNIEAADGSNRPTFSHWTILSPQWPKPDGLSVGAGPQLENRIKFKFYDYT